MRSFAMRTISAIAVGILFGVVVAPRLGAEPQFNRGQGRDRVCFYQDVQYRGWEQCYSAGDEVNSLGDRKAQASSLRIFGRIHVTVYDKTGFAGRSDDFTSDVPDLGRRSAGDGHTWNDRISSVRIGSDSYDAPVYRGGNGGSRFPDQSNQRIDDGVCVYERPNFEGRSQCWRSGADLRDLGRAGNWSDRISSIRVFGRAVAVLYRDINFRGESVLVDNDISDLARLQGRFVRNWNHQISSLQIEERRGNGRARGRSWIR